ncbi:hypothetical protein T4D_10736 [Trichinella pseudospiralis]|uniref:Uncharacterized protein n=1 Tax=Trichinella pseudospiralis TaxID=6337 RepID=A0A0V1F957_TRIPS|nr:hypothetical protein T4D_10736 [Trichinella pseudospiralis]
MLHALSSAFRSKHHPLCTDWTSKPNYTHNYAGDLYATHIRELYAGARILTRQLLLSCKYYAGVCPSLFLFFNSNCAQILRYNLDSTSHNFNYGLFSTAAAGNSCPDRFRSL